MADFECNEPITQSCEDCEKKRLCAIRISIWLVEEHIELEPEPEVG